MHKGFKIQAALCIERPPLRVLEPDWKRRWRTFKEAWDLRTNNTLTVEDEVVFMRYHFQFLEDQKDRKNLTAGDNPTIQAAKQDSLQEVDAPAEEGGGLGALLAQEGINLEFPQLGRRAGRRRKVEKKVVEEVDDGNPRSPKRLPDCSVFLLVRYARGSRWTFPKADRAHGQAMRETLLRLCAQQMGAEFAPYVVGACPFAHRKRRGLLHPGIDGRKVFYYRARALPKVGSQVVLPDDGPVADWAWFSRKELAKHLDPGEWYCVRDGLPLDPVMM